jgi:putative DNA modification/repair radical SAM protein
MIMDVQKKLSILADAAKYDASCSSSGVKRKNRSKQGIGNSTGVGICHSYTPDGRCISLLKVLLTNICIYDCQYCINRISSNVKRARFTTDEIATLTMDFYKRNYIEGLFLSSGIIRSEDYTMELLVDVARCLRTEHDFHGYIHLKAVPGASKALLADAGRWADRLSANIELPTQQGLDELAPAKNMATTETTMDTIREMRDESREDRERGIRSAPNFAPGGQSTQMIVGATPSSDASLLKTSSKLYTSYKLKRVYYSAYSPIPDAARALPAASPPLIREHRLYQADWLMRFYGFDAEELTTPDDPNLSLDIDPKLAWALRHRHLFPVDINRASKLELLRVPGLGTRSADRIVRARRHHKLGLEHLKKLGVVTRRAAPFIKLTGRTSGAHQLDDLELRYKLVDRSTQGHLL